MAENKESINVKNDSELTVASEEVINTLYLAIQKQAISNDNRTDKIEYRAGILFAFNVILISLIAQYLKFDNWYSILISSISIIISLVEVALLILTIKPRNYRILDIDNLMPFDVTKYAGINKIEILEYLVHSELDCVKENMETNNKKIKLFTVSLYIIFCQVVMLFINTIIYYCS